MFLYYLCWSGYKAAPTYIKTVLVDHIIVAQEIRKAGLRTSSVSSKKPSMESSSSPDITTRRRMISYHSMCTKGYITICGKKKRENKFNGN